MIDREIDSPTPSPFFLLEVNGTKSSELAVLVRPGPVSATSVRIMPSSMTVEIVSLRSREFVIASIALRIKLTIACSI